MLQRLWKPWFVYQPAMVARRAYMALRPPPPGYRLLRTSWGVAIIADPSRTIGRSIVSTGVYDLAVSEALARLITPGDTVIDAGANVGYMTVLASVATGPGGRVLAFEPHPGLFPILKRNLDGVHEKLNIAATDLHQSALGKEPGEIDLHVPSSFETNDGVASIARDPGPEGRSMSVRVETLDRVVGQGTVGVLKLDVEGFEAEVLRGATRALSDRRIRHIVFEEHALDGSEVVRMLRGAGYRVFSLGWSLRGPAVRPMEAGSLANRYEAPSFIASLAPDEVLERTHTKGWMVLRGGLIERCTGR